MFGKTDTSRRKTLTRRSLMGWLATGAGSLGLGTAARAEVEAVADPALRDAALRGLALAEYRGDPVAVKAADLALKQLETSDPEGALLLRLYRASDVRPAGYFYEGDIRPEATEAALEQLHNAIAGCFPVSFQYVDLSGNETQRTVLPLALVHPPQGVKLMAYCLERKGYRQFFVRTIMGLSKEKGNFREQRFALLEGLIEKEAA